jgi:hypothetical protein
MAADPDLLKWLEMKAKTPDEIESRVLAIFSPPGFGKTVISAMFGDRTFYVTDEMQGQTSFKNHPDLKERVRAVPYVSHNVTGKVIQAVENKEFLHSDGQPYDVIVLDTVSGMTALEIQKIVKGGVTPAKGRVSAESASQPDYMVSEKRMLDLMAEVANLQRCTLVLLSHQRVGDKLTPGDNTRLDVHAAAFRVINKYASVIAYLDIKDGNRRFQVMPTGNGISVKSRYRFPREFVTTDEFVAHIRKWKEKN